MDEHELLQVPDWLIEVLHVVWGFARREHEGIRTLVPAHAQLALEAVPPEVLRAARITLGGHRCRGADLTKTTRGRPWATTSASGSRRTASSRTVT
jgi:hypothetical protein